VPLAVKDVDLQLDYPADSTATASLVPTPAAAPVPSAVTNAPAVVAPPSASISPPASSDDASTPAPNAQNPALLSLPVNVSSTPDPATP
jgi:hypothetical protein